MSDLIILCAALIGHASSKSGFGPRTVILCDQCEREYHVGCLRDHNMDDLKELLKGNRFCCADCDRIHTALQKLIVRGEEKLPDSSLHVVRKKHAESSLESKDKLDERFDPISDSGSSKGDLIPSMVYG
ncbi:uncharacterized protein LOC120115253 [Hibiscus syriacus]|uniref:uncharacterized protein LOC120115253 n=1 Tax=Hibiscus syriacus TaxID=106335 RepID=UPI0019243993|nr:uncharacterized protein LOC120115253 [Hibiscus syriacus]